jgi:hypothetical protein
MRFYRSQLKARRCWLNAVCVFAAAGLWHGTVGSPRVAAHGPAPSVIAVVDADATGPKFLRLTGGLARRSEAGSYRFVCPAAWGDDVVLPAAAIPGGPVVVAGGRGLYLLDGNGVATPHPDPMAAGSAIDFARMGGKLYMLRTVMGASQVLEVDATAVRMIFSEPTVDSWTSIAATADTIGLQRLATDRVEQVKITAEGMALSRESAPAPQDPILIIARATTQALYSVVATATGRELGQIEGDQWKRIELAVASIAGPVDVPDGQPFIAVDTSLVRLPDPTIMLEGMPPVSCLGRLGDIAYACTRDGASALAATGVGQPIFALASMTPPDLTQLAAAQQTLCETQWEHFRFDLLALGVELADPMVGVTDAGPPAAAGVGGTTAPQAGAAGAVAGSAAGAGEAGAIEPPKPAADGGCTVVGPSRDRGVTASGFLFAWIAFAFAIRRRSV